MVTIWNLHSLKYAKSNILAQSRSLYCTAWKIEIFSNSQNFTWNHFCKSESQNVNLRGIMIAISHKIWILEKLWNSTLWKSSLLSALFAMFQTTRFLEVVIMRLWLYVSFLDCHQMAPFSSEFLLSRSNIFWIVKFTLYLRILTTEMKYKILLLWMYQKYKTHICILQNTI